MPLSFWWDAFSTVVYIINGLPTQVLQGKSPMHFVNLRVFRCSCYPCLKPYQDHKIQYHSKKCVYIGSSPIHKGYKCLSPSRPANFQTLLNNIPQPSSTGGSSPSPLVIPTQNPTQIKLQPTPPLSTNRPQGNPT